MSTADLLAISDPADRAVAANDLLWSQPGHAQSLREARRQAIVEAVDQGRTHHGLAELLHVCPDDLAWMIQL